MTYFWDNGRRMKRRGKHSMMALRGTLDSNSKNNTLGSVTFDNIKYEQCGDLSERSSRRRQTSNEARHNSIRNRLTTPLFPSADNTSVFCDEELILQTLLMRCSPVELYRKNVIDPMKLSNAYQASNEHCVSNLENMYAHGFEEIQINHILRELALPFSDLHEAFADSEDEQKTDVREESDNVDDSLSSSSFDDEDDDGENGKLTPWYRLPEERHAVTREEDEKSGYKLDPEVLAEKLNVVLSDQDESDKSYSIKGDEVDSETRSKLSSNPMPWNTLSEKVMWSQKRDSEPCAGRKSNRVSSLPQPMKDMPDENGPTGLGGFPFRFQLTPNVSWWQRHRNGYGHPSKKLRAQLNEVKSSIETFIEEYEHIYRQFEEIFKREHSDDPQLRKRVKWRRVPTSRKYVVGGRHVDFERMMELQGDPTKFVDCLPSEVDKTAATQDKAQKPTQCGEGSSGQQHKTGSSRKVDSVARKSKFTIVGQWKSNSQKGDIECQTVTNKDVLQIWQDQLMEIIAIKNTAEPEEMQAIFDLYERYNCLFSFASEFVAHTMLDNKWEIMNAKRREFYNDYKKTGKTPEDDLDAKIFDRFTHLLDENINFISVLLSKDVAPEESRKVETHKDLPWAQRISRYDALSFPDFYFRGNENICYCVSKKPSENGEKNKHRDCNCRFLLQTRAYNHPIGLEDFDYRFIPRREFQKLDPQTTKQAVISWTANEDRTREYAKKRVDIALKYWYQKAVHVNELFKVMHTRFSMKTIETLRRESKETCCRSTWYCYNMKGLPPSSAVPIFRNSRTSGRTYSGRSVKFTPRRILGYRDICPFCDMLLVTHHPSLSRFVEYRFKHMVCHMTYRAEVESRASKINQQHDCNAPATTCGGGEDHKCHGGASEGGQSQGTGAFPHENCYLHRKVPAVLSIFNGRILNPMEQQKMIDYYKRVDKFEHAMIKTRILTKLVEGSEELDLLHHKQAFNVQLYEFINEHTTRTIATQIEKILINQEMHVKLKRERHVKVKFCKRSRDWPLKLASQMNQEELARYLSTNERPAYKTILVKQDTATRAKEQTWELLPIMHRDWLKAYRLMKEDIQQVVKRKKILRKLNDLISAEEFYSLIAPLSLSSLPVEEANQKITIK